MIATACPDPQAPLVEWAQWYAAALGWPVFPILPGKKGPLISKKDGGNGFHDATTDPEQIMVWWTKWPTANIGMPTGEIKGVSLSPALDELTQGLRDGDVVTLTPSTSTISEMAS